MTEAPSTRFAKDQLLSIVERVERLNEEKKAIGDDIKEVFAEAKANGYDVKQLRRVIRNRAIDPSDRSEQNAVYNVYWKALGHDAEEPAYVALAADAGEALGRDAVMSTLQKLVPVGVTFDMNFGKGDKVRIRRLDDGTAVVEPIEDEPAKPPAAARPGKTAARAATVLTMVPKDPVKDAADRAEEAARAKSTRPIDVVEREMSDEQREYDDKLYQEAVGIVRTEGLVSVSLIQRRLQLGYNRAVSLVERMERDGFVSPSGPDGKRIVLTLPAET